MVGDDMADAETPGLVATVLTAIGLGGGGGWGFIKLQSKTSVLDNRVKQLEEDRTSHAKKLDTTVELVARVDERTKKTDGHVEDILSILRGK